MEKLSLIDLEHLYGVTCYISGKMHASSELTSKIEGITSAVSKKKIDLDFHLTKLYLN